MNVEEVFQFMNRERLTGNGDRRRRRTAEAALIGFAVTPELEIVFDTVRI